MEPLNSRTQFRSIATDTQPKKKIRTTINTITTIVTEEIHDDIDTSQFPNQSQQNVMNNTDSSMLQEQIQLLNQQLDSIQSTKYSENEGASFTPVTSSSPTSSASSPSSPASQIQQSFPGAQIASTLSSSKTPTTVDVTNDQPISTSNILEKGLIYFFYRPRIGLEIANDMNDVQRFFILLQTFPEQNQKPLYRLLRIGKKKLPSLVEHNRFWGIVEEATDDKTKIDALLSDQSYSTVTRGERKLHSCVPVGEGVYALVMQNNFCHLAYVLENPTELGSAQNAFNIELQGSYILTVKNPQMPKMPPTPAAGLPLNPRPASQQLPESPIKVQFPPHIQEAFQGRRFAPAIPKEMLNFKGAEIVVIGETNRNPILYSEEFRKIEQELGIESQHHLNESALYQELKAHIAPTVVPQ